MENHLKGKCCRVSDFHNSLDEHNKLESQNRSCWSPSPPSSSDESTSLNNDSNDSETESDSHDIVFSESEADSCSSSTITDDSYNSYSTVTGENNHNSRVFDDWQTSSSEDDAPSKKRQRVDITCFVCGDPPKSYYNPICICVGCKIGYHQKCHKPHISDKKLSSNIEQWLCTNCQNKANNETSILCRNRPNNIRVDTNLTLNNEKLSENTIESVNRQVLGRDEGITNIGDLNKNRKPDFYQEKSNNKYFLTVKKDIKSDNHDVSSRLQATSDQRHKFHKKRRGLLPVIIQPFERRHSTASELRKLFEKCPLSIVNFDEIFIPEEWSDLVEIPTTSVEYIMPSTSSIPSGTPDPISFKQSKYVDTSTSIDYALPNKISTLTGGKNVVSIRKHASLSPTKNPATPALKRVQLPSKNTPTPTNKNVVTSSNNNGTKSITPSIKGTDTRSRGAMVSRDKGCTTPGKNPIKNGRGDSSSDDELSSAKRVISSNKPVGSVDTDDADFNIMSLLPPNLIPCLNFGELAFREGTIDRKKTIKRGRVFPVIK